MDDNLEENFQLDERIVKMTGKLVDRVDHSGANTYFLAWDSSTSLALQRDNVLQWVTQVTQVQAWCGGWTSATFAENDNTPLTLDLTALLLTNVTRLSYIATHICRFPAFIVSPPSLSLVLYRFIVKMTNYYECKQGSIKHRHRQPSTYSQRFLYLQISNFKLSPSPH